MAASPKPPVAATRLPKNDENLEAAKKRLLSPEKRAFLADKRTRVHSPKVCICAKLDKISIRGCVILLIVQRAVSHKHLIELLPTPTHFQNEVHDSKVMFLKVSAPLGLRNARNAAVNSKQTTATTLQKDAPTNPFAAKNPGIVKPAKLVSLIIMHDCVKFSIPISGCQCFDSHSERGQAFGVQRKQPDGQIQAGDEVEYVETDHSLGLHGT